MALVPHQPLQVFIPGVVANPVARVAGPAGQRIHAQRAFLPRRQRVRDKGAQFTRLEPDMNSWLDQRAGTAADARLPMPVLEGARDEGSAHRAGRMHVER